MDLSEEHSVQVALADLIRTGLVLSAHDVSDGGLAVCLAESALWGSLGAEVYLECSGPYRLDALLFGEAQSRIVLTVASESTEAIEEALVGYEVQVTRIGTVEEGPLRIHVNGRVVVDQPVGAMERVYNGAIPRIMERPLT